MSSRLAVLLFFFVSFGGSQTPEELVDEALRYRLLTQVAVHESLVAFTVSVTDIEENVGNSDIWIYDSSEPRLFQLTRGPKSDNNPRWSPDGKRLAFVSNRAGKPQLFLISPFGGEAEPATKFDKLAVDDFRWLPDGAGFIFVATDPPTEAEEKRKTDKLDTIVADENRKFARLYRYKVGEKEPERLTEGDLHVTSFDVSPDGEKVVFAASPGPEQNGRFVSDVHVLDLAEKSTRPLAHSDAREASPKFSPDGEWVAFTLQGDVFANDTLHRIRLDGGGWESLSAGFDESVGDYEWVAGDRIEFVARRGVESRAFSLAIAGKTIEPVGDFDEGLEIESYARSRTGAAFALMSGPERPTELYRVDGSGAAATRVTDLNRDFVTGQPAVERLRYRSADGWNLEGVLLRPPDADRTRKLPLLVVIHGGPAGVHSLRFRPLQAAWPIHAFVRKGYAVFLPNPRGSTGFGAEFRRAVVDDWGGGDFRDIQEGVDLLVERGAVDPDRMGVMGWSYGGYMTAWTITQTDRYRAASVGAGITNTVSMYGTQDIPDFFEAHFGDRKPWEAPEAYGGRSAIAFIANAKTPTLIQHGAADERVPVGQAQELHTALKKVGVETQFVLYPRQGHAIREPKLIRDALLRSFRWFEERVRVE